MVLEAIVVSTTISAAFIIVCWAARDDTPIRIAAARRPPLNDQQGQPNSRIRRWPRGSIAEWTGVSFGVD